MAEIRPFRALRFASDELEPLVAPPYDVISPEQRADYLARDPHNVVHLTLPDSEEAAARTLADWKREGVLVEDEQPAMWALEQEFTGPDGVRRSRSGVVASLQVEPAEPVHAFEEEVASVQEGLRELDELPRDHPAAVVYDGTPYLVQRREPGVLDVQFVDRLGHDGISYTPSVDEAVAKVDAGEAKLAVLLRPPLIDEVRAAAERGEVMPQKSTYFYPKLLSGLLFHPL